jgi:hypothetical protein
MQYVVETSVGERDFVASMREMRTWFDHRRIEPDAFRHATAGERITFYADFRAEPDAVAFARAFGGRVIRSLAFASDEPEPAEALP